MKAHEGLVLSSNPYTTLPLGVGDILSLLPSDTTAATEKTSPLRGGHLQVDLFLLELLIKCHTKNTEQVLSLGHWHSLSNNKAALNCAAEMQQGLESKKIFAAGGL